MIKILKNPKTEEYNKFKERVCSNKFIWTYSSNTNNGFEYAEGFEDVPFYSHCLLERATLTIPYSSVNSHETKCAAEIFNQIMVHNNLSYKTLYRMNLNCTSYVGKKLSPPHVDHDYPHQNMIIYLSKFDGGKTHVFKKKWPESELTIKPTDMKYSFKGEEDDIITFDGLHYHCMQPPDINQRRIILVATYLI